jgi:hypothetical protein
MAFHFKLIYSPKKLWLHNNPNNPLNYAFTQNKLIYIKFGCWRQNNT